MTNTASKYFLSSWALEFCSFDSSFQAEKNWQVKQEKSFFFFHEYSNEEKIDIELFLLQANVILYVCNSRGKINIKAFDD